MMIFGLSRWVAETGKTFYVKLHDVESGQYSIRHFLKDDVFEDFVLKLVGGNVFEYSVDDDSDFVDRFQIFRDGILEISFYGSDDSGSGQFSPPVSSVGSSQLPRAEVESRFPEKKEYRFWAPSIGTAIFLNATPVFNNAVSASIVVDSSKNFVSASNPVFGSRDMIDQLLEDADGLFRSGKTGVVHFLQEENKIVIPFSDGSRAWTEEYPAETFFYKNRIEWFFESSIQPSFSDSDSPVPVGEKVFSDPEYSSGSSPKIDSLYDSRDGDIPYQFRYSIFDVEKDHQAFRYSATVFGVEKTIPSDSFVNYSFSNMILYSSF